MEHELCAGVDGTVAELLVQPGDAVDEGDVLVRLQPTAARDAEHGLGAQSRRRGESRRSGHAESRRPLPR